MKAKRLALAVWTMAHGFAMLLAEDAFARTKNVVLLETDARQMLAMVCDRPRAPYIGVPVPSGRAGWSRETPAEKAG